jgi:hypothetical protein
MLRRRRSAAGAQRCIRLAARLDGRRVWAVLLSADLAKKSASHRVHSKCRRPQPVRVQEHSGCTMGAEEVQKLWDSMRASRITTPAKQVPDAPQPREHAAPLAAAPAPPDAASWATLDAFVECASRGSAALADSAVPARRAELERLHALVKARGLLTSLSRTHAGADTPRNAGGAAGVARRGCVRAARQAAPAAPGGAPRAAPLPGSPHAHAPTGRLGAVPPGGSGGVAVAGAARAGVCSRAASLRRARAARAPRARRRDAAGAQRGARPAAPVSASQC